MIPGIKVDQGLRPLPGAGSVETLCTGLDGLVERAADYYAQGARFAKWRAVLQITADGCPSDLSVRENSWGLARYARSVQESGLVPIIEPEILMDGDHTIEVTAAVQERVIQEVDQACHAKGVLLEGTLLKPSMTVQGADCPQKADPRIVAEMTVRTLERSAPANVPGIVFLSGGLSEEAASIYLNTMNSFPKKASWNLGFSYGRALQHSCLKAWKGSETGNRVKPRFLRVHKPIPKPLKVVMSQGHNRRLMNSYFWLVTPTKRLHLTLPRRLGNGVS